IAFELGSPVTLYYLQKRKDVKAWISLFIRAAKSSQRERGKCSSSRSRSEQTSFCCFDKAIRIINPIAGNETVIYAGPFHSGKFFQNRMENFGGETMNHFTIVFAGTLECSNNV